MSSVQAHDTPDAALSAYIDAAAAVLALPIPLDWRQDVLFHLKAIMAASDLVQTFPLDDELEAAPIYEA